jgi:CRP-like cAMP-binding protein
MKPNEIIQKYISVTKELCPKIADEALHYFTSKLTISELKPKQYYIMAGTVQKEIGYIFSGLMRTFYIDGTGKEITVDFTKEGNYATHFTTFGTNKPSKFYFQSIEQTVIINISYQHFQDCCEKFPELERCIRLIVSQAHNILLGRMEGFLFDSAETRYLNFTAENPDLFNRVSISDLCTYLGVERQTLTRIRKKLIKR